MTLMTSPADIARFLLAGNATLTLRSLRTETHFTFKVRQTEDKPNRYFVSLLSGPDNTDDYSYIGLLDTDAGGASFRTTAKSRAKDGAPSVEAFRYFTKTVVNGLHLPATLEVRHEGKCGRCGRALTVPESIDRGIGPECWEKMGSLL